MLCISLAVSPSVWALTTPPGAVSRRGNQQAAFDTQRQQLSAPLAPALGGSRRFNYSEWDFAQGPSPNATGNLVFDTVRSFLQHWPNTRYRNGELVHNRYFQCMFPRICILIRDFRPGVVFLVLSVPGLISTNIHICFVSVGGQVTTSSRAPYHLERCCTMAQASTSSPLCQNGPPPTQSIRTSSAACNGRTDLPRRLPAHPNHRLQTQT